MIRGAVTAPLPAQLLAARAWLAARDPILAAADAAVPPFEWRIRTSGFAGLVKMVVQQQVSIASATAIWGRFEAGLGVVTPETVLAMDETALRAFGLSSQKARYVRAIAEAKFDFDGLFAIEDEAAIEALTAIKGVGRWTAETYLMFCEGRLDTFPAGDVALQEAVRIADRSEASLDQKALYVRAEAWRPYRGVAAHLLWAYYGAMRRGEAPATIEGA